MLMKRQPRAIRARTARQPSLITGEGLHQGQTQTRSMMQRKTILKELMKKKKMMLTTMLLRKKTVKEKVMTTKVKRVRVRVRVTTRRKSTECDHLQT